MKKKKRQKKGIVSRVEARKEPINLLLRSKCSKEGAFCFLLLLKRKETRRSNGVSFFEMFISYCPCLSSLDIQNGRLGRLHKSLASIGRRLMKKKDKSMNAKLRQIKKDTTMKCKSIAQLPTVTTPCLLCNLLVQIHKEKRKWCQRVSQHLESVETAISKPPSSHNRTSSK